MSYGTTADLYRYACPASAVSAISLLDQQAELDAQSAVADGYLSARYSMPLSSYGVDLTMHVCWLAEYSLLTNRGLAAESDSYIILKDKRDAAIKWLSAVQAGKISPPSIVDSTPAEDAGGVYISSDALRGW